MLQAFQGASRRSLFRLFFGAACGARQARAADPDLDQKLFLMIRPVADGMASAGFFFWDGGQINVDFTFENFKRTAAQLRQILYAYGEKAGMDRAEVDDLFMGEGFDRLVLAAGGVPRDFLSLLLEALSTKDAGQERIGKDDVRQLSLHVFQRRIQELKVDAEQRDQDMLLKGINAITRFCLEKKENVFLVPDQALQEENGVRELLNRLLDYRIIHTVGVASTHKSHTGTFAAFALDIGAYAKFRKLEGRFREVDITAHDARERVRNSPILEGNNLLLLLKNAPPDPQEGLDDAAA